MLCPATWSADHHQYAHKKYRVACIPPHAVKGCWWSHDSPSIYHSAERTEGVDVEGTRGDLFPVIHAYAVDGVSLSCALACGSGLVAVGQISRLPTSARTAQVVRRVVVPYRTVAHTACNLLRYSSIASEAPHRHKLPRDAARAPVVVEIETRRATWSGSWGQRPDWVA